jgi:hypothetical protein
MAYGLKVYDANGNVRLDTNDREFRYVANYSGNLAAGATANITVSGLSTDGTWGVNEQGLVNFSLDVSISTNTLTVENIDSFNSRPYYIQVFRI